MNIIEFRTQTLDNGDRLFIGGIKFSNSLFIKIFIDNISVQELPLLNESLIVYSELLKSLEGSGLFLIFTSASGIADEGGWEGVTVRFEGKKVHWDFEVEDTKFHFEFEANQYKNAIRKLEGDIAINAGKLKLEPAEIFFPESWN